MCESTGVNCKLEDSESQHHVRVSIRWAVLAEYRCVRVGVEVSACERERQGERGRQLTSREVERQILQIQLLVRRQEHAEDDSVQLRQTHAHTDIMTYITSTCETYELISGVGEQCNSVTVCGGDIRKNAVNLSLHYCPISSLLWSCHNAAAFTMNIGDKLPDMHNECVYMKEKDGGYREPPM